MANGIIRDDDFIVEGKLIGPREFFIKLGKVRLQLTRIQNEGDAHSNAVATKALKFLDEAFEAGK